MAKKTNQEIKVKRSEAEWKDLLPAESYRVLRQGGTEAPFSGTYNLHFESGNYCCKACGEVLFASEAKFNSHCGWPSFDRAIQKGTIKEVLDTSHGMVRTEVRCASCDSHLGHLFPDGPTETGMRYCINSVCLDFRPKEA